jgi:dTDP-4-amino-4,6-dideoxygalactose transaminase
VIPADCEQSFHLYFLVLHDRAERDRFITHLADRGILAVFHYIPLSTSPRGMALGGAPGQCPVAEDRAERLVRLPFFFSLSDADQDEVVAAVLAFEPEG